MEQARLVNSVGWWRVGVGAIVGVGANVGAVVAVGLGGSLLQAIANMAMAKTAHHEIPVENMFGSIAVAGRKVRLP